MASLSVVLLGCRVLGPAALSAPAARRAERVVEAFRSGLSEHVLACGGKSWRGVREADALCAYLMQHGLPGHRLERELWSHSTRQNARYAAELLLPRGISRVLLVTCDWHMPRALLCFKAAGFDARPLPAVSPRARTQDRWWRAARECVSLHLDQVATRGFSRV